MKKGFVLRLSLFYVFGVQVALLGKFFGVSELYVLAGLNIFVLLFLTGLHVLAGKERTHAVVEFKKTTHEHVKSSAAAVSKQEKRSFTPVLYILQHYVFVVMLFVLMALSVEKVLWGVLGFPLLPLFLMFGIVSLLVSRPLRERKIYFVKKLFLPRQILFLLSVIVLFSVVYWFGLWGFGILLGMSAGLLFSLLFFAMTVLVFHANGVCKIGSLWGFRILFFAFLFSLGAVFFSSYFSLARQHEDESYKPWFAKVWEDIRESGARVVDEFETEVATGEALTGDVLEYVTGELIGVEFSHEQISGEVTNVASGADVGSGVENVFVDTEDVKDTGSLVVTGFSRLRNGEFYGDQDPIVYSDALIYLLDAEKVNISKTTEPVKFVFVSSVSADYSYFRAGYVNKLIGKDVNPDAKMKCDNYVVMKGLLQKWDVKQYSGGIFDQYFAYGRDEGALNGCEMGKFVTKHNL